MPPLSRKSFAIRSKGLPNYKPACSTKENIEKAIKTQDESASKRKKLDDGITSNINKAMKRTVSLTLSIEETPDISKTKNKSHMNEAVLNISTHSNASLIDQLKCVLDETDRTLFDRSSTVDMFISDTTGICSSSDSGVISCLTEEVLNSQGIKEQYLKHWKETLPEDSENDFRRFSQGVRRSGSCSTKCVLDETDPTLDRSVDMFKSDTTGICSSSDSGVISCLTQEVLNSQGIKEQYLKHWKETLPEDSENDFRRFSQELRRSGSVNGKKSEKKLNEKKEPNKKNVYERIITHDAKTEKKLTESKSNLEKEKRESKKENKAKKIIVEASTKQNNILKKDGDIKKRALKENSLEDNTLDFYEKMLKIQESRNVGLYVACDSCDNSRYLPDVKDPLDLPEKWYCEMNPDPEHNKCTDPEEVLEDEEYLIHNLYNAGSVVWAKIDGFPWWPAMVEDDPDVEDYFWLEEDSMVPTWYHVTFFDSKEVTRAWLTPDKIKPFKINMNNPECKLPKNNKYKIRLNASFNQAVDALTLPLLERLHTFSFIKRFKKPIISKRRTEVKGKQNNPKKNLIKKGNEEKKKGKRMIQKQSTEDLENDDDILIDQILKNNIDYLL